jgi:hypothetical protein
VDRAGLVPHRPRKEKNDHISAALGSGKRAQKRVKFAFGSGKNPYMYFPLPEREKLVMYVGA